MVKVDQGIAGDLRIDFGSPVDYTSQVARTLILDLLDDFGAPHTGSGTGPTHIFNLGHGISQHTPPEHVAALVEAVHSHSAALRGTQPRS